MTEKHTSPGPIPTVEEIAKRTGYTVIQVQMYGQGYCENNAMITPQVPKCRIRNTNYPGFWDEFPELYQLWQDEGVIITSAKEWEAYNATMQKRSSNNG